MQVQASQSFLERFFKLSEKGTTVKTEVIAGFTTFIALAYIMFVNPNILAAAGATMADVVETEVMLADIADFAAMNAVYAEFFTEPYPARAAFQVGALPRGAKVEIKAVARV